METLIVTSPPIKGDHIVEIQEILNGRNRYKEDYYNGKIDGVVGEMMGQAFRRAKWWMGYAEEEVRSDRTGPIYGDKLHNFLTGQTKLPEEYERRRRSRVEDRVKKSLGQKALEEAIKHIGVKESPAGSNKVRFSEWYGMRGPWCAMFVTWCYVQAGSHAFVKGARYAYCPFIVFAARMGQNGLSVTRDPKPGDLVMYDWHGDGVSDHIELFEEWVNRAQGTFKAVGGNTAPDDSGSQSNGGGVFRRGEKPFRGDTRRTAQVQMFVRVGR